jgi:hypothetical protein
MTCSFAHKEGDKNPERQQYKKAIFIHVYQCSFLEVSNTSTVALQRGKQAKKDCMTQPFLK